MDIDTSTAQFVPATSPPAAVPIGSSDLLQASDEWPSTSEVRIAVVGDIDASNADPLTEYIYERAAKCRSVIVDLRDVEFFGTEGFSLLCGIDARCTQAAVSLKLIAGESVTRVTAICDPDRALPIASA
jgi:anti-anti-sigma factor